MFLVALRTMNLTQSRWIGVIVEPLPLKNELGVYTTTSTSIVQSGDSILQKPARDEIARWIVFLHSDLEYTWPDFSFVPILNLPMNLLTFGWWRRHKKKIFEQFTAAGDFSVWPFLTRRDYESSLKHPRYLAEPQA